MGLVGVSTASPCPVHPAQSIGFFSQPRLEERLTKKIRIRHAQTITPFFYGWALFAATTTNVFSCIGNSHGFWLFVCLFVVSKSGEFLELLLCHRFLKIVSFYFSLRENSQINKQVDDRTYFRPCVKHLHAVICCPIDWQADWHSDVTAIIDFCCCWESTTSSSHIGNVKMFENKNYDDIIEMFYAIFLFQGFFALRTPAARRGFLRLVVLCIRTPNPQ